MQPVLDFMDSVSRQIGTSVRWLALLMVIATCAVVVMRYVFELPSIALQEAIMYCHAALFMLGSAYTWQQGGHVRVDVLYRNWSPRRQRLINLAGILLFVLPLSTFLLFISWQYVANAWAIRETSPEASGLPFVYLLKTMLVILPITMLWQSIAEILRLFVPTDNNAMAMEGNQHG